MANETKTSQPDEKKLKAPADPLALMLIRDADVQNAIGDVKDGVGEVLERRSHADLISRIKYSSAEAAIDSLGLYENVRYHDLAVFMIGKGMAALAVRGLASVDRAALKEVRFPALLKLMTKSSQRAAVLEAPDLFGFMKEGQGGVREVDFDALEAFVREGGDDCGRDLVQIAALRKTADFETVEKLGADQSYRSAADLLAYLPRGGRKASKELCLGIARSIFADRLLRNHDVIDPVVLRDCVEEMIIVGKAGLVFQAREHLESVIDRSALLALAVSHGQPSDAIDAFKGDWAQDISAQDLATVLVRNGELEAVFMHLSTVFSGAKEADLVRNLINCGFAGRFFDKPEGADRTCADSLREKLPVCVAQSLENEEGIATVLERARYFCFDAKAAAVLNAWAGGNHKLVIKFKDAIEFTDAQWFHVARLAHAEFIDCGSLSKLLKFPVVSSAQIKKK